VNGSWDGVTRSLHWLMAVLIVVQATVGWVGAEMERSPLKIDVLSAHKSLGISLLLLVLVRLLWRWTHTAPSPPEGTGRWMIWSARVSHYALYLLMLAVPFSGWLSASTVIVPWKLWWVIPWPTIAAPDQRLHKIAEDLHENLVWWLVAFLTIHVAAALWHHFGKRDRVLLRMLRGRG